MLCCSARDVPKRSHHRIHRRDAGGSGVKRGPREEEGC